MAAIGLHYEAMPIAAMGGWPPRRSYKKPNFNTKIPATR